MSIAEPSPLNDNDSESDESQQRVFVRVIATRAGAPWDQSRQAGLEARLGAPARLADVIYRVKRLEPWRPAQAARFAAVYARAEDVRKGFRATPTIDGRVVPISFVPAAAHARRLRDLLILGLMVAGVAGAVLSLIGTVASRRSQAEMLLSDTEQLASARLRLVREVQRMDADSRLLDQLDLRGQRLSNALAEIAWASTAKTPSAHIQALHWDHGLLAVEADGDNPPYDPHGRPMQRSRAPVRPGVWLWGLPSSDPWGADLAALEAQRAHSGRGR